MMNPLRGVACMAALSLGTLLTCRGSPHRV